PAWSDQAVRKILSNRIYTGVRLLGKEPRGEHAVICDGSASLRDDASLAGVIRIPGAAPALISEEVFEAVHGRLHNARARNRRPGVPPLPLAGLGRCGHCGGALFVERNRHRGKPIKRISCGKRRTYGTGVCGGGGRAADLGRVLSALLGTLSENLLEGDA